ncbi:Protein CBG24712 [Caenorhabditis briggsae]|uniref:Protein CBG24712 n=1 Tax=Caenorhabditis briggsae TaxID=6238 RepID=H8WGZ1_CAEBR|nr:Protein CBG24712 [Caenorhabditis briggsae]CCG58657.1 Protein CBG24712 [Caenorhabditis briggsae]
MTSYCFLFFLFVFPNFTYGTYMIATNGSPQGYGIYNTLNLNWADCLDYCNQEPMCMAIYNNGSDTICQYFEIGNLNSVKRGFDFLYKIGFKTNSTTCAFNDTASGGYLMGYNETLRRSTYNGWDFKYDEVSENWIFESTGVTMCPASGWKLSVRPKGPWCFTLYPSGKNAEITHAQAVGNCSSKNSDSHISGVETQEEYDYLITRAEGLGWQTWPLLKRLGWMGPGNRNVLGIPVVRGLRISRLEFVIFASKICPFRPNSQTFRIFALLIFLACDRSSEKFRKIDFWLKEFF